MKKADLEELPVLDPRRLSPSQLQRLSDLFDALSEEEFERLPGMAHCPTRRRLDDGISEILGLPDLATLRDLLGLRAGRLQHPPVVRPLRIPSPVVGEG